jgi:hypothetical protein
MGRRLRAPGPRPLRVKRRKETRRDDKMGNEGQVALPAQVEAPVPANRKSARVRGNRILMFHSLPLDRPRPC